MKASFLIPASLAALLAAGCPDTEPDPAGFDAGGLDAGRRDAGAADAGDPDAGLPPPRRALAPMPLLGDTAVENLVHCPHFDLATELWYGFSGQELIDLWRVDLPSTPTRLPALEIRASNRSRYVIGMARGGPGPLLASVWIGRALDAPEAPLSYAIYGLGENAVADVAFELQPVEGSVEEHGKIRWQRYAARIEEELLGVGTLVFGDDGGGSVYLNGPELRAEKPVQGMPPRRPGAATSPRPPTLEERAAVRRAMDELRKRAPRLPPDPADGVWRPREK